MPRLLINNISISYQEANSEQHKSLFLIHGNSSSSNVWKSQLSSPLFANYHLIAPDLPGCGESGRSNDPSSDYAINGQAKTIAGFINELGLNHLILIGHSGGAHRYRMHAPFK